MNNRKNQNSILVLATLGVYLGLVLVGATPQVLAQAATAKQFDLKDEAGRKDDLDKKPDDKKCSDLGNIAENRLGDFGLDKYTPITWANVIRESVTDFVFPNNEISANSGEGGFLGPLLPKSSDPTFKSSLNFKIEPHKAASTFRFTYTLESPSDAYLFALAFDYGLKFSNCRPDKGFYKLVYDGSEISHENNQVFIVTRLPRAGLDALLAKDAK